MGTIQSKDSYVPPSQLETIRSSMKAKDIASGPDGCTKPRLNGYPDLEFYKVVEVLGLDVGEVRFDHCDETADDRVIWLENSLGLQSQSFLLRGKRWKGLGRQPIVDPKAAEEGTAFVKVLPRWNVKDMVGQRASTTDADGETSRAPDNTAGIKWDEPADQLARERHVLRVWQKAEETGELQLPEDSLLVIPRLFDNFLEEGKPSLLVFEDLLAAGFKPQRHLQAISVDDGIAVARALADLHGALWRIRGKLFKANEKMDVDKEAFLNEAAKVRTTYEKLLRNALEDLRLADGGGEYAEKCLPVVGDISNAFVDVDVKPVLVGHGDAWVHNVMLRRDLDGKVDGVAFVDLGSVRRMNPLVDFFSFLGTMMDARDLFTKDKFVQAQYEARLRLQLPCAFITDDMTEVELFSLRAKKHAYARMLAFFFNVKFWWVKGASMDNEPCVRTASAFNINAMIALL